MSLPGHQETRRVRGRFVKRPLGLRRRAEDTDSGQSRCDRCRSASARGRRARCKYCQRIAMTSRLACDGLEWSAAGGNRKRRTARRMCRLYSAAVRQRRDDIWPIIDMALQKMAFTVACRCMDRTTWKSHGQVDGCDGEESRTLPRPPVYSSDQLIASGLGVRGAGSLGHGASVPDIMRLS